jgi:hypothetical protein
MLKSPYPKTTDLLMYATATSSHVFRFNAASNHRSFHEEYRKIVNHGVNP